MTKSTFEDPVESLTEQLQNAQLSYRDLALKSRREATILKRLITRLISASQGRDEALDKKLHEIRLDLDKQDDIASLIPRLAIVERMVIRHNSTNNQSQSRLDQQFDNSSESLKCLKGLPSQLKRDLRLLLDNPELNNNDKVIALLKLYERAVKLLSLPAGSPQLKEMVDQDLFNRLCCELQTLIDEFDLDGEAGNKLLEIRNKLQISIEPRTLLELTLESMGLLVEGTRKERKDSRKFIIQINDELSSIQHHATQTLDGSKNLLVKRHELRSELETSVNVLENGVNKHQTLAAMRPSIDSAIANLRDLVIRNQALEAREQALTEQLHVNEQKIETLQQKTVEYHKRLGEQERKLLLDPLTKVYNRTALEDRLQHEYRCWLRYKTPFCLAIIDIDHFKNINDNYGHLAGDRVLKIIARTIHKCLKDTDFIARFGGEEFIVLLPDADAETRESVLSNITQSVSALPFKFKNRRVSITASIGASLFEGKDIPTDVLERADQALYQAKHNGRNQIVWS